MAKNFFYRVNPCEVLAEAIFSENKEFWFMQFFQDLKNDDPSSAKIDLARNIIQEAHEFRAKRSVAGKASVKQRTDRGQQKATHVQHMLPDDEHNVNKRATSNRSSNRSSTETEALKPKPLAPKADHSQNEIPYDLIIDHFNSVTGRAYRNTETNRKLIKVLWKEGFREADFSKAIENQQAKWGHDPKYQQYLRPSTIYRPINFESYVNAVVTLSDRGIISQQSEKGLQAFRDWNKDGKGVFGAQPDDI